ncbi:MAG TPA: ribosome biogenesis factor YjgA [Gammaproteobacteria bacterium]|nr:ribosome biogenesis factor YjgA [Gammaproteobacteria bacterium]
MSDPDDPEHAIPSKSQRKRDAQALQGLGEQLVALPAAQLEALDLPEPLREAVGFARTMDARGARKRQIKFIARLLRETDAEPIRAALEALHRQDRQQAQRFQRLEALRERLLTDGDEALAEFLRAHPHADHQHLRRLVRQARLERERDGAPRSARALFRLLRELTETD